MPSFHLDAPRATLALGMAALGATSVATGDFLPQLQPVGDIGAARWALATAHGAVVIVREHEAFYGSREWNHGPRQRIVELIDDCVSVVLARPTETRHL